MQKIQCKIMKKNNNFFKQKYIKTHLELLYIILLVLQYYYVIAKVA